MPQQTKSDGSGEEPGLIGRFIGQYGKKQTSRAYRTDLQKFESFLKGNLKKKRDSAALEDASRRDVLRFLFEESQSVSRSTLRRRATALKSFFGWLKGKSQRAGSPIGEDENVSELVDSVFEEGPPAKEDRGSADPGRKNCSEVPTAEREPTSNEELTKEGEPRGGKEPTAREDPSGGEASPGSSEKANREDRTGPDEKSSGDQASRDEEEEESTSGEEETYTPTEGPLDIPHWICDAADEKAEEMVLTSYGKHIPLAKVPGALQQGLDKLADWVGSAAPYNDYIHLVCRGGDLLVKIEYRQDPSRIVAQIEHQVIERVARRGPDSLYPYHSVPERALWYFRGRRWSMPPVVYKLVDFSHTGGRSDELPTWRSTSPGLTQASYQTTVEVTGALAKAFGLAKDEKVLISLSP